MFAAELQKLGVLIGSEDLVVLGERSTFASFASTLEGIIIIMAFVTEAKPRTCRERLVRAII